MSRVLKTQNQRRLAHPCMYMYLYMHAYMYVQIYMIPGVRFFPTIYHLWPTIYCYIFQIPPNNSGSKVMRQFTGGFSPFQGLQRDLRSQAWIVRPKRKHHGENRDDCVETLERPSSFL